MINLKKLDKPQILVDHAKEWTDEYLGYIARGEAVPDNVKYRYRHKDIKKQLIKETHGKCAYCESDVLHISPGDVEHILPKNKDAHPELYVEWDNLTFACEVCNREYKKDYNDDSDPLLNPYKDDVDSELVGLGPLICPRSGSRKGQLTIDIIGLNRAELLERRLEAIDRLSGAVSQYCREKNKTHKKILLDTIQEQFAEDKEFSFVLRSAYGMLK